MRLTKNGTAIPVSRDGAPITTILEEESIGGSADTWGEFWSSAEVQGPGFSVLYPVQRTSASPVTVSLDALRVRLTYP